MTDTLKIMVRGAYDLQALRMQTGLRLCSNFRSKLMPEDGEELDENAIGVIDELKASYKRLTDGIARNRTLPEAAGFKGDALISTWTELALVDQYLKLESTEGQQFRLLTGTLEGIPIYDTYLKDVRGVGPAMAAVLITSFDIHKAGYISSFWKYAGLDVANGKGRSRREEHLVDRAYTDKNGKEALRKSVTYNPWLKMKLLGALAPSFLRSASPWRESYDGYKHRLETDPVRIKLTITEWKKRNSAKEDVTNLWPPGRIHAAANRYMVKMFLAELWTRWRELEGLPVTKSYHEAKLGHTHRAA